MSDNPQYGTTPRFDLPHLRVVRLQGRDAAAFAQAQFMNDVAALDTGRWQRSGWLDPKGRVQALFLLLRRDDESLLAVTAGDAASFAASLRRFVFRSKVAIEVAELHASGEFAAPDAACGDRMAVDEDGLVLDVGGDGAPRTLRLDARAAATDARAAGDWCAHDLRRGWPDIPGAKLDAWTPQQLSLQRFPAFSVRKGCYPGQEIVARTHFLGRAKREAVLFERIEGDVDATRLTAEDGSTADVAASAGRCVLAVASRERPRGAWTCDGATFVEHPFAEGATPASYSAS